MRKLKSQTIKRLHRRLSIASLRLGKAIFDSFRKFFFDQCMIRASGLAYNTLLAAIPMLTFVFALFTAFGAYERMIVSVKEDWIPLLIPTRQEELFSYIDQFTSNSKALGTVGIVVFAVTSVMLLVTISNHFNHVWGVRNRSNFIRQFTTYTSIIVLGSLMIALSLNIPALFRLPDIASLNTLYTASRKFSTALLGGLVLLLMLLLIPSGKVRFRSALVGALVGTALWSFIRFWFAHLTNYMMRMSIIYGSIAIIPIFLLWIYITWLIILYALECTYIVQFRRIPWKTNFRNSNPIGHMVKKGFVLIRQILSDYHTGKKPKTVTGLARATFITKEETEQFLQTFLDAGLIGQAAVPPGTFFPAKSIDAITQEEIFTALMGSLSTETPDTDAIDKTLQSAFNKSLEGLGSRTARDLLDTEKPQSERGTDGFPGKTE